MIFWLMLGSWVFGVIVGYVLLTTEEARRGANVAITAFALSAAKQGMVAEFKQMYEGTADVTRREILETDRLVDAARRADADRSE